MTSDSADLKFGHSAFQGRFGIARADITPPVGVYSRCWGAAAHDTADSIHRPLQLTVLVLSSHDDECQLKRSFKSLNQKNFVKYSKTGL